MVELIAENPYYDRYHADLRRMLRARAGEIAYKPDEDNPLMNQMMDEEVSEEEFLVSLGNERTKKTDAWRKYRQYISRLRPRVAEEKN